MASKDEGAICLTALIEHDDLERSKVYTYRYNATEWTTLQNHFSVYNDNYSIPFGASNIPGLIGDYDLTPVDPANFGVKYMDYFGCESGTESEGTRLHNICVGW